MKKFAIVLTLAAIFAAPLTHADPAPSPPPPFNPDHPDNYTNWPCGLSIGPEGPGALLNPVRLRICGN